MARPEDLVPGNCFFWFAFHDPERLYPSVQTLRFVGLEEDEGGTRIYLFEDLGGAFEAAHSEENWMFREEDLSEVLDFQGLIEELRRSAFDHPIHPPAPSPEPRPVEVAAELRRQVERFFADDDCVALTIGPRYSGKGLSLARHEGAFHMSFVPDQRSDPTSEKTIRAEFAGVAPIDDYLADRGRVRILAYPIEPDLDPVVARCMRLLEEAFAVKPGDPLCYTPLARE